MASLACGARRASTAAVAIVPPPVNGEPIGVVSVTHPSPGEGRLPPGALTAAPASASPVPVIQIPPAGAPPADEPVEDTPHARHGVTRPRFDGLAEPPLDIETSATTLVMGPTDTRFPAPVTLKAQLLRSSGAETTTAGREHAAIMVDEREPGHRPVPSAIPSVATGTA